MYKKLGSVLYGCLFCCTFLIAQNPKSILNQIEQNNQELKAFRSYMTAKEQERRGQNQMPDLEIKGYYLPITSNASTPDYTEFEVSQSFEFPTVYKNRNALNQLKEEALSMEYYQLRQTILLETQQLCLTLSALHNRIEIAKQRRQNSEKVYQQTQVLFDKGAIGILERNKAQVIWLQKQFEVDALELEAKQFYEQLVQLNGGVSISPDILNYKLVERASDSFETLWNEKQQLDPEVSMLSCSVKTAEQNVKLRQQQLWPDIALGYNSQGVSGQHVSGVVAGLSIPLWGAKSKIKSAKANLQYQKDQQESKLLKLKTEYQQLFQEYQLLEKNMASYKASLEHLTTEALLMKAYELGEYSFMDYHLEVAFYHQAENKLFEMELALQKQQAKLLKHHL